jgi:hypothetical protein
MISNKYLSQKFIFVFREMSIKCQIKKIYAQKTRPRGRPRNRWQDEVRKDGRIVGEEEW